jgi:hypothetical protein
VAVAVAAWLAELSWPAVVGVMALALAIAWLVEWVSWREGQASAVAPRLDHRPVVAGTLPESRPKLESEPEPEPEPEPESVVEPEPPPAAETVSEPVAVEADPEPVPPSAEEPETAAPTVPEPVETAPEAGPVESAEEPEAGEAPVREAVDAPAPKARRPWHGMSLRRVDPPEATTPEEPKAPVESEPAEGAEPAPAPRLERPVKAESRPEPEPRPGYPSPREVQSPQPQEVAPAVPPAPANVVRMQRSAEPRAWNVWELESLAREQARLEPERGEEWSYLFVHLRQFADAEGKLPSEFDPLVRESFGELLETLEPA